MNTILISEKTELQEAVKQAVQSALEEKVPDIIREATSKPWMTKDELMELTGWSSRTLQNLRDTNQIPYSQHGHKILYPRKGIMEFLKAHEIKPHGSERSKK